ncbi:uncharacterized protein LOC144865099 [Branchiostoma floridae x Branchiostoma japonicum]
MQRALLKRSRPTEMRPKREVHQGSILKTGNSQHHHLHQDETSLYNDHIKEGDSSLARADLDSAEQHFAAALKIVHVRDPTAQQYQREVEPLYKLGDVYSKRGQQTGDGGDFVKAAALYNAAKARSEDQVLNRNLARTSTEVERLLIKCILGIRCSVNQGDTEKDKKQLKEMRDQIKLEMETIDQQLDPYVHDEDDPCVKQIEAKRAQAVRHLFENIVQQRKEFISQLVEECIGLMGPPPCKYALIGLGSQATGLVTPYSDLEFAILVEKEKEECLVYFRNLTHYLHLKVVNLGETILPALGIRSLNDFYSENPLDNWYYDSVTPRGFAFDGSMQKASKTPLGRQETVDKPPSELICTPENMVKILQNDVTLYLKEGYHLATILRNPCLIAGDQDLIDTFMAITGEILQADGGKMARQLAQEILKENVERFCNDIVTSKLIDVKKELYRFPAIAVDCLALSSCIIPTTVWKTIEEMANQQVISPNNAHHLVVLTSISAELRLRTYIANGGQKENLSALASVETELHGQESSLQNNDEVQRNAMSRVFHLPNVKQLFRYYYTALPVRRLMSLEKQTLDSVMVKIHLYDSSPSVKGMMYYQLCKHSLAFGYFNKAIERFDVPDMERNELLLYAGCTLILMGQYQKGVSYLEQALQKYRSIYGETTEHPYIATSLSNLGSVWMHLGEYRQAISYFEQSLQMYRSIYGQTTAHSKIATSLNNLGGAWDELGDYKKAISYHDQALQISRKMYGEGTAHPEIATSLNSLGKVWQKLSDHQKAISYYDQALQMERSIYGQTTAHPKLASSLNNLGMAWNDQGDYNKAISYHEQSLQMRRSIYGEGTAHPDIAIGLNNLGLDLHKLGVHRKAISYYEQALQMYRGIYGQTKAHPEIAISLNNLGRAWEELGDYRKAINYHEQSLQIYKSTYGQNTAHANIATSLNNLAAAWLYMGDLRKAVSYLEQALQMQRSIYGQTKAHPEIASSLNNLGAAWAKLGDDKKVISCLDEQARQIYNSAAHPNIATSLTIESTWSELEEYKSAISYFEQALQMMRRIYGQTKAHPDVARLLNNLGEAWGSLGDQRRAISYHEQALQMSRSIYGQTTAHPVVAILLHNLGEAWTKMSEYRKAISYYDQALQMRRSIYGKDTTHPEIASSLNNLGFAWHKLGDYGQAIGYYNQALQMKTTIHGHTTAHPEIATLLMNLGVACSELGDCRKAVSYIEQALEMHKSIYGEAELALLLNNMGLAWNEPDDLPKSIYWI